MRRYRANHPEQLASNADRNRRARAAKKAKALLTAESLTALRATLVDSLAALEATDWTTYERRTWLTLVDDIDTLLVEIHGHKAAPKPYPAQKF